MRSLTDTATDDGAFDDCSAAGLSGGTPGAALLTGQFSSACSTEDRDVSECGLTLQLTIEVIRYA